MIKLLKDEVDKYKLGVIPEDIPSDDFMAHHNNIMKTCENKLAKLHKQKSSLHDLLEQEVYNIDTFLERSNVIQAKMDEMETIIKKTQQEMNHAGNKTEFFEALEFVVDTYESIRDISEKNMLLKKVIDRIDYRKEKSQRLDEFTLNVQLKI